MRGNEFLDKMELIDPAYVEAADVQPKRKKSEWRRWGAVAACLCLVAAMTYLGRGEKGPHPGEIVLSNQTTAKVSYGYEAGMVNSIKTDLVYLTEEEMFGRENMYIFRGRVSGLTNVTIDFNGVKEIRCIATVEIERVYQGNLVAGEQIKMLLPCGIDTEMLWVEDTDVIANLECGMEGIFMPWVYDETSYTKMNGAVLMKQDLAACGLADGVRWAFLDTDQGLLFERSAYPGAKNATNLDDIEDYVMKMLK